LERAVEEARAARERVPAVHPNELLSSLRMLSVSPGYPVFRDLLIEALLSAVEETPRDASDATAAHALYRARGLVDVLRIMQSAQAGKEKEEQKP